MLPSVRMITFVYSVTFRHKNEERVNEKLYDGLKYELR